MKKGTIFAMVATVALSALMACTLSGCGGGSDEPAGDNGGSSSVYDVDGILADGLDFGDGGLADYEDNLLVVQVPNDGTGDYTWYFYFEDETNMMVAMDNYDEASGTETFVFEFDGEGEWEFELYAQDPDGMLYGGYDYYFGVEADEDWDVVSLSISE